MFEASQCLKSNAFREKHSVKHAIVYTSFVNTCTQKKEREKEILYALDVIFQSYISFQDLVHVC